jgi:3-hydroxyisobutyrate dehydrogenase-like beta-hydroxyacid dehydrogenase
VVGRKGHYQKWEKAGREYGKDSIYRLRGSRRSLRFGRDGQHSGLPCEALRALEMRPTAAGETVGQASAIKMLRSVMIKGLEALTAECFLAARRDVVEAQVLASLETSDPDIDWRGRGIYNLDRMMIHGERRAAEMREVALTVSKLGLPASMSAAAAEWQEAVAALDLQPSEDEDLWGRLDRLLARL